MGAAACWRGKAETVAAVVPLFERERESSREVIKASTLLARWPATTEELRHMLRVVAFFGGVAGDNRGA